VSGALPFASVMLKKLGGNCGMKSTAKMRKHIEPPLRHKAKSGAAGDGHSGNEAAAAESRNTATQGSDPHRHCRHGSLASRKASWSRVRQRARRVILEAFGEAAQADVSG
jgi:hypothetical protein